MSTSVARSSVDTDLAELLPEGTARPPDVPREIFDAALRIILGQRRLDMRSLAAELKIGRTTLYRKAGSRDQLLGQVMWYLTRQALVRAYHEAAGLSGSTRVLLIIEHFLMFVSQQPSLRRLLESEPEAALRVLTSKHGIVQRGIVEALERLLAMEDRRGFRPVIDRPTLAYAIVRIGESFLYADVIADKKPDVGKAVTVIAQLLRE
ncbi:MAG: TetR/AcrR family transcriptional regulator [Streptosporangiales bacterium]|nr:TetR/AcrR family transcriptional regulator [Streptosporangiales bacterium]